MAEEIAANSPLAVQGTKAVLAAGEGRSVAEGLEYVAAWNAGFLASDDLAEAMAAFMEKRPAVFTGRSRRCRSAAQRLRRHQRRSCAAPAASSSRDLGQDVGPDRVDDALGLVEQLGRFLAGHIGHRLERRARPASRGPIPRRPAAGRRKGSRQDISRAPREPDRARRTGPPRPSRRSGSGSACTLPSSAWPICLLRLRCTLRAARGHRSVQPTDPSICSSISRLHSTAYSMGRVRVIGSMNPLTIMPMAWVSDRPRLIR